MTKNSINPAKALQVVISTISDLDESERIRVIEAATTFFGISISRTQRVSPSSEYHVSEKTSSVGFSDDRAFSPKEFLMEKNPKSNIERIACLAYYLTHYRDTPYFKTLDLSKLNTEAAQPKLSNPTQSANDAVKAGYIVPASKGQRQLSAFGEQFVNALPNRDEAKTINSKLRPKRRQARNKSTNTKTGTSST